MQSIGAIHNHKNKSNSYLEQLQKHNENTNARNIRKDIRTAKKNQQIKAMREGKHKKQKYKIMNKDKTKTKNTIEYDSINADNQESKPDACNEMEQVQNQSQCRQVKY